MVSRINDWGGSGGMGSGGMFARPPRSVAKKAETKALIKSIASKPPLATPKSNVKAKPAAKTKALPIDKVKVRTKNDSSNQRAADKAYKEIEAEIKKYKASERTGYEHRYASDAAERAGNSAKLSPKIARKAAASNPVAKKALKAEKKSDKRYWEDMYNSSNG